MVINVRRVIAIVGVASVAACSGSGETVTEPIIPGTGDLGLLAIEDLQYEGAFRLSSATFGSSSTNYVVGSLAYNPENHSLFIAGHATQGSVAEFAIPVPGMSTTVSELPVVDAPIQPFVALLDANPNGNPEGIDRITGMLWLNGQLIVNAETWYERRNDGKTERRKDD